MKRLFRFLLWVAGLAVFLLVTAHFTLRHALNTPKFKAAATGFIERTTGRPAEYERIDYTLFPFSLVVRNAALKEPDGARDFAAMKEFSVKVDFRAKEITAIQLTEPAIRIVQHPDGSFNFSDLIAEPAAAPESEPAAPAGRPPAPAPKRSPRPTPPRRWPSGLCGSTRPTLNSSSGWRTVAKMPSPSRIWTSNCAISPPTARCA